MKPLLLDLFCGEGGAAMGYHRAGFEVVGVDIVDRPDYPFEFHQGDALRFLKSQAQMPRFSAIHASPPCKAFTKTGWAYHFDYHSDHEDLLTPTREALLKLGNPWVIENVPGAPMRVDLMLCGSQFGLGVRRHRWFELGFPMFKLMHPCDHRQPVVSPHGNPNRFKGTAKEWATAMDIDWMSTAGLSQAIPPAYTEFIGLELMAHVEAEAA